MCVVCVCVSVSGPGFHLDKDRGVGGSIGFGYDDWRVYTP